MQTNVRCAYPLLILALFHGNPAQSNADPVSTKVQAGDVSVTAKGDGASASVNIGVLPSSIKPGCRTVEVKVGNIQKTALGRNATASINIPETQTYCEEKQP